jgi:hypothetical protein
MVIGIQMGIDHTFGRRPRIQGPIEGIQRTRTSPQLLINDNQAIIKCDIARGKFKEKPDCLVTQSLSPVHQEISSFPEFQDG